MTKPLYGYALFCISIFTFTLFSHKTSKPRELEVKTKEKANVDNDCCNTTVINACFKKVYRNKSNNCVLRVYYVINKTKIVYFDYLHYDIISTNTYTLSPYYNIEILFIEDNVKDLTIENVENQELFDIYSNYHK